jgi:hypothetical protein
MASRAHDKAPEQERLLRDRRFFLTPYAGRPGWVSLRIGPRDDWDEVNASPREVYRRLALERMLRALRLDT